jgi:hypothetical protein
MSTLMKCKQCKSVLAYGRNAKQGELFLIRVHYQQTLWLKIVNKIWLIKENNQEIYNGKCIK